MKHVDKGVLMTDLQIGPEIPISFYDLERTPAVPQ